MRNPEEQPQSSPPAVPASLPEVMDLTAKAGERSSSRERRADHSASGEPPAKDRKKRTTKKVKRAQLESDARAHLDQTRESRNGGVGDSGVPDEETERIIDETTKNLEDGLRAVGFDVTT